MPNSDKPKEEAGQPLATSPGRLTLYGDDKGVCFWARSVEDAEQYQEKAKQDLDRASEERASEEGASEASTKPEGTATPRTNATNA